MHPFSRSASHSVHYMLRYCTDIINFRRITYSITQTYVSFMYVYMLLTLIKIILDVVKYLFYFWLTFCYWIEILDFIPWTVVFLFQKKGFLSPRFPTSACKEHNCVCACVRACVRACAATEHSFGMQHGVRVLLPSKYSMERSDATRHRGVPWMLHNWRQTGDMTQWVSEWSTATFKVSLNSIHSSPYIKYQGWYMWLKTPCHLIIGIRLFNTK
jgi:hypothetical protein